MDPLTITTACLALSRAALSTATELHKVINQMRDAPNIMRSVCAQVELTRQCTERLGGWLESDAHGLMEDEIGVLKLSLLECKTLMVRINQHIGSYRDQRNIGIYQRAKHAWNETALKEDTARLETQMNAQQHLLQLMYLPQSERANIRRDFSKQSILSQARDSATIYSSRDNEGSFPYEDELANTTAYKNAFASMMDRSSEAMPPRRQAKNVIKKARETFSRADSGDVTLGAGSRNSKRFSISSYKPSTTSVVEAPAQALQPIAARMHDTPRGTIKKLSDQLGKAAGRGENLQIGSLLDQGADIDFRDQYRRTALQRAYDGGHTHTMQLLVDRGAKVNDEKNSLLFQAVKAQNIVAIRILAHKTNLSDPRSNDHRRLMHTAAAAGHLDTVRILLEHGAHADQKNSENETPLQTCVKAKSPRAIKLLVDHGADVEAKMPGRHRHQSNLAAKLITGRDRPIHWAVHDYDLAVVKALLDAGAWPKSKTEYSIGKQISQTRLMSGAWLKYSDIAMSLESNTISGTPLMIANDLKEWIEKGPFTESLEAIERLLIERGADPAGSK